MKWNKKERKYDIFLGFENGFLRQVGKTTTNDYKAKMQKRGNKMGWNRGWGAFPHHWTEINRSSRKI